MSHAGCVALPGALISRPQSNILRPRATTFIHPALIRSHLLVVCGKLGNGARARSYVRVEPTAPVAHNPIAAAPWYVKGAAVLLGCATVYNLISRLRGKGSLGQLEERGLIDEDRHAKQLADDPFYNKVMKNINTVAMDELSPQQIEAARKRRMRERDTADADIEKIVLPENHPFAVQKKISKEEEDLMKARLAVKRGLPLQDLHGKRGLPDDAFRRATQQRFA